MNGMTPVRVDGNLVPTRGPAVPGASRRSWARRGIDAMAGSCELALQLDVAQGPREDAVLIAVAGADLDEHGQPALVDQRGGDTLHRLAPATARDVGDDLDVDLELQLVALEAA